MLDKDTRDEINEMIEDKIRHANNRIYEMEVKQTVLENTISGRRIKPRKYQVKPHEFDRLTYSNGNHDIDGVSSSSLGTLLIILLAIVISLFIVFLITHNVAIIIDGQHIDILPS